MPSKGWVKEFVCANYGMYCHPGKAIRVRLCLEVFPLLIAMHESDAFCNARFLHRDPKWFSSVSHVHRWVDGYIDNAFTCLANEKSQSQDLSAPGNKSLLREMARNFPSREELRSQITAVFMPARETIGFAMGNVFHAIARHPDVYQKLREEILEHAPPEQPLIYDTLKSLRYTQAVVNESELLSFFCSLA